MISDNIVKETYYSHWAKNKNPWETHGKPTNPCCGYGFMVGSETTTHTHTHGTHTHNPHGFWNPLQSLTTECTGIHSVKPVHGNVLANTLSAWSNTLPYIAIHYLHSPIHCHTLQLQHYIFMHSVVTFCDGPGRQDQTLVDAWVNFSGSDIFVNEEPSTAIFKFGRYPYLTVCYYKEGL